MIRIFLIPRDVGVARLICGPTELFGGFYWHWVDTRIFLFSMLVIMDTTTRKKLVDPIHSADGRSTGRRGC